MKYLFLFALSSLFSLAANEVHLVVAPDQIGRVNDHQIRVDQIQPGGTIHLQVILKNLDYTLAGAEFTVHLPSFATSNGLVRISTQNADYQCVNAPIRAGSGWGTSEILELPVDASGTRTAGGTGMAYNLVRFGTIVKNPNARPVGNGTGDRIIADLEFYLGNLSISTCKASLAEIEVKISPWEGQVNDFFADSDGNRKTMNGTSTQRIVTLTNPTAPYRKGDMTRDGFITTGDVSKLSLCANEGQSSANCVLRTLSVNDYTQIADMDCNGLVSASDTAALLRFVMDTISDFKSATQAPSMELERSGNFILSTPATKTTSAAIRIGFKNAYTKITKPSLSVKDRKAWTIVSVIDEESQDVVIFLRSKAGSQNLPDVNISYLSLGNDSEVEVLSAYDFQNADEPELIYVIPQ